MTGGCRLNDEHFFTYIKSADYFFNSVAQNNYGLAVLIAYASGVWLLLALPWFFLEKKRPGQPMPPGKNVVTVMFWTLGRAMKQIFELRQSLLYLIGYFLLGDSLNVCHFDVHIFVILIHVCQRLLSLSSRHFSTLQCHTTLSL